MGLTITAIVCGYNESSLLAGCLYSLVAQTRPPDDILVINSVLLEDAAAVREELGGHRAHAAGQRRRGAHVVPQRFVGGRNR
jgi:GT2 family glycosyltransferase